MTELMISVAAVAVVVLAFWNQSREHAKHAKEMSDLYNRFEAAARAAGRKDADPIAKPDDSDELVVARLIEKRLASIHMSIDEQRDLMAALLKSQNMFVKSLKELTGIDVNSRPEEGDDEYVVATARKLQDTYGISREEALERARKQAVYHRVDGPMGDRV